MPDDRIINLALLDYHLGRFKSLNSAAKAYNLPPSTVKARNKRNVNRRDAHADRQLLTPSQEQYLVEWILDQEAIGLAPNHTQLRDMASLVSRLNGGPKRVGRHWLERFLQRHPEIKPKLGRAIASQRVGGITKDAVQTWYDQLIAVIERKAITLDAIWNMDEMGTAFGYCTHQTVFGTQDTNSTFVRRPQDREWCTSIECISCLGLSLTPLIIFKAKHVQQQWFVLEDTPNWAYTSSSSAFTNNTIGLEWLKEIFIPQSARTLREGQWRLLLLDGHKSHIIEEFMQYAYTQRVYCYYLIPHASHILQPLDLAVFSSLKRRFRELVALDVDINDFEPTKKAQFLQHYQVARERAITVSNCVAGFKAAGINPFDPTKALLSRFIIPSTPRRVTTPPPPPTTSNLAYDITTTPSSRRDTSKAIWTIQKTHTLPRDVRTVLAKMSKALDRERCNNAANSKELNTMKRKLATLAAKSKKKQPVNSNKLFVDLNEIREGETRSSQAISEATATPAAPVTSPLLPIAPLSLQQVIRDVTASLLAI